MADVISTSSPNLLEIKGYLFLKSNRKPFKEPVVLSNISDLYALTSDQSSQTENLFHPDKFSGQAVTSSQLRCTRMSLDRTQAALQAEML